ncbi:hypothetical protein COV13_02795 [Candidatus Woesearchaeota archaeon CG10_big_fil_rev_8_21_14_0_10_32_9]|nr:MAG: hypothetical protein COV13_02795 [Candidatus Woesearchaeota archaeon CG10_big_fil_rev_8_21_14_0_10_32_9]
MAEQFNVKELAVKLKAELGLLSPRNQEDFGIFFNSAYEHYSELLPSYVRRNVSFLLDSLFITISHSTDPVKNPTGFGLALGSFVGLLEKLKHPEVTKAIFSNAQATKFFRNSLSAFSSVKKFDRELLKPLLEQIDTTLLEGEELREYNENTKI